MKPFLFIALCLFYIGAHSQITDSTEIKLTHYKELFVKGLITADEYEKLKGQALGLEPKQAAKIAPHDTVKLSTVIDKRNNRIVSGTILTTVGAGFGIGSIAWAISDIPNQRNTAYQSDKQHGKVIGQVFMGVGGVGLIIGGIVLLADAGKYNQLIKDFRAKNVSIIGTQNSIGLAYKF